MKTDESLKKRQKKVMWGLEKGKVYFSRTAEQRFFFVLTLIMLLAGILYKLGVLH